MHLAVTEQHLLNSNHLFHFSLPEDMSHPSALRAPLSSWVIILSPPLFLPPFITCQPIPFSLFFLSPYLLPQKETSN